MSDDVLEQLDDEAVGRLRDAGPTWSQARWDRVEDVLAGLDHEVARYRWDEDSEGDLKLYIEVAVAQAVSLEELVRRRTEIQRRVREVFERVHVFFADADEHDDVLSPGAMVADPTPPG